MHFCTVIRSKVNKLLKPVSTETSQEDKSEKLQLIQQVGPDSASIWRAKRLMLIPQERSGLWVMLP